MNEDLEEIILNKPLDEATPVDYGKGTARQRRLKEMREEIRNASLEELKARIGNDELAEIAYKSKQDCREGYMRIRRQWPSLGKQHEGWTYVFMAGLPLHLAKVSRWYTTSNIKRIDWEGKTFETLNSIYAFEFVDADKR